MIAKSLGNTSLQHVHIYARLDTQSQRTALDDQANRILRLSAAPPAPPPVIAAPVVNELAATPRVKRVRLRIEREE